MNNIVTIACITFTTVFSLLIILGIHSKRNNRLAKQFHQQARSKGDAIIDFHGQDITINGKQINEYQTIFRKKSCLIQLPPKQYTIIAKYPYNDGKNTLHTKSIELQIAIESGKNYIVSLHNDPTMLDTAVSYVALESNEYSNPDYIVCTENK